MNNVHAFKALILKYESITQEMIDDCDHDSNDSIAEQLTGFGGTETCTLCISAKKQNDGKYWDKDRNYFCNNCIWRKYTKRASGLIGYDCLGSEHGIYTTWSIISDHPDKPEHYHERAKLMRNVLKQLGYKQPYSKIMKNVKECDVILLATKGPSKIWKNNDGTLTVYKHEQFGKVGTAMHMYIVSPDNINDGDLVITNNPEYHDRIWEFKMMSCPMPYWGNPKECKKIVATDNPALKDTAFCTYPTISFEFMQLYAARYNAVTLVDAKVNIEKVNVEFIDGKVDERTGILRSNVNYDLTTNCIFVDFKPVKVAVTGKPDQPVTYSKAQIRDYYYEYVTTNHELLTGSEATRIRQFIESLK